MARTKKLTDPIYSPTNPTNEAAIRAQIDDSIQEVYDKSSRNDATVNLTGNQTVAGVKTFSTSPIVPTPTTSTQVANKAYVDGVAISATIPLNSLTDDYLASAPGNIKPRVATLETNFSTAQTNITNLETDIDIITTAVSDTGLVNAMVVNTAGTFDMAKNGNVTPFIIPLFTNTATATLSIDGGAVTGIRKANDAGTLVVLEAGDIKKNVPTQFVLDTVSGFFVYAPKGGATIKSIQRIEHLLQTATQDLTITAINPSNSIAIISFAEGGVDAHSPSKLYCAVEIINSTTVRLRRIADFSGLTTRQARVNVQVIEFNGVKSKQTGNFNHSSASQNITITSIAPAKSVLYFERTNSKADDGSTLTLDYVSGKIANATTLTFQAQLATLQNVYWQLIEFN